MHRIDAPSATADHKFTEGSPAGGIPATTVTDDWLNDVQENICYAIEAAGITLVKGSSTQLQEAIVALASPGDSSGVFPGAMVYSGRATPPTGWLKCNGAAISRTTYATLFEAIGVTFGAGNGTTTFNVPDLRAEFIRGLDDGRGIDSSRAIGSNQAQTIQSHNHTMTFNRDLVNGAYAPQPDAVFGDQLEDGIQTLTSSSTGGTETRPRNVALPVFIKY